MNSTGDNQAACYDIIVVVSGGLVQSVYAKDPNLQVCVQDWDNIKDDEVDRLDPLDGADPQTICPHEVW